MKVITAGLSKTGTTTMVVALQELGYRVYDSMEHYEYHNQDWEKILTEGGTTEDFRRMYSDVDAVTDTPACFFWDEIHAAFPEAKIILTLRENEDVWYQSWIGQLKAGEKFRLANLMTNLLSPTSRHLRYWSALVVRATLGYKHRNWYGAVIYNENLTKMKYRRHNAHVLQNAPKDKLLVYSVNDGWEPLCKFLDKPVPAKPFPHENVKGSSLKAVGKSPLFVRIRREAAISKIISVILMLYGGYKLTTGSGPRSWAQFWVDTTSKVVSSLTSKFS